MIDFLNIASVVLALVGMTLPVINIMLSRRNKKRNWGTLSFLSLSSSAISIWLPYVYLNDKVTIEDWAALMDTMPSILRVWGIVLFVTILLNAITYFMNRNNHL